LLENPKDYDSMFYIAEAYASYANNISEAIKWAEKYALQRDKIKKISFNVSVYYMLITMYMKISDMKKCWEWLEIALKEVQDDVDLNMALLRYGLLTNNQNLVAAGARAFVNAYRDFNKNIVKRGGRFVFNYDEKSLAMATFHLAITYLEHSVIELKNLQNLMPKIPKKFSDELQQGLKDWFGKNETIFKHNDALLQATETAKTLYSVYPKSNRSRLRTLTDSRPQG
jgi:hypothetical protein